MGFHIRYTYDAAGNQTQVTDPYGVTTYYAWDALGQMSVAEVPAGTVTMTYNAHGQRVQKTSTDGSVTNFLFDHKRLLHETDGSDDPTKSYTTLDEEYGDLISTFDETGTPTEFYHQFDAQHSTNALIDPDCDVVQTYKYQAFGLPAGSSDVGWANMTSGEWGALTSSEWAALPAGGAQADIRFTFGGQAGYSYETELGLYLLGMGGNGQRLYDPATGRFKSEDSIRQAGGTLNLYQYERNDPLVNVDPSGNQLMGEPGNPMNPYSTTPPTPDIMTMIIAGYSDKQITSQLEQNKATILEQAARNTADLKALIQGVGQAGQAIGAFNNGPVGRTLVGISSGGWSEAFRWAFPKTANFIGGGYGIPNALASVTPDPRYDTRISRGFGAAAPIIVASLVNPFLGAAVGAAQGFGSAEVQAEKEGWTTGQTFTVGTERAAFNAVLGLIPGSKAANLSVGSVAKGLGTVYGINVASGVIDNKLRADLGLKSESDLDAFLHNAADPSNIANAVLFESVRQVASSARSEAADKATLEKARARPATGVGSVKPIESPKPGTLSNLDARRWYHQQLDQIEARIPKDLPKEQQYKMADQLRTEAKVRARDLMADREAAAKLDQTDPVRPTDYYIEKAKAKGLQGDDLWDYLIKKAQESRASVDKSLGLERKPPEQPSQGQ